MHYTKYTYKRSATAEMFVLIQGHLIPIYNEFLLHYGDNVIPGEVRKLDGCGFEEYKQALSDCKDVIDAGETLYVFHRDRNFPPGHTPRFLSTDEYELLNSIGFLTAEEQKLYAELKDRREAEEKAAQEAEAYRTRATCIYLIKDRQTGYIKIGESLNPERRLKDLLKQGTMLPTPNDFSLLFHWKATADVEKYLHTRFASQRVRGEWFALTDEEIEDIRRDHAN